jgi:hypothetical protein
VTARTPTRPVASIPWGRILTLQELRACKIDDNIGPPPASNARVAKVPCSPPERGHKRTSSKQLFKLVALSRGKRIQPHSHTERGIANNTPHAGLGLHLVALPHLSSPDNFAKGRAMSRARGVTRDHAQSFVACVLFLITDLSRLKLPPGGRRNIAATTDQLPIEILPVDRLLTAAEFQKTRRRAARG